MELAQFEHDAWRAAVATAVSYGIILFVIFVLLFLVPYGIFTLL